MFLKKNFLKKTKLGFYDSGLGGLTVLDFFLEQGFTNFLYFADTKNFPLGELSKNEIERIITEGLNFLDLANCQINILACNTADSHFFLFKKKQNLKKFF